MRSVLPSLGLAVLISAGVASSATAGERYGYGSRHHGPVAGYGHAGYGGVYGFADAAIGGNYVGAPFTRFPRPSEIVPPAWGYGTYGVPTVTGIRQAPTAAPTLTVIDTPAPKRRATGPRILSRDTHGRFANDDAERPASGVRVISVTVPRR